MSAAPSNGADPGLVGPNSVTWQLHADPAMWLAGIASLLLWVHCAEVSTFLFVVRRPGFQLTKSQADHYFDEQRHSAALVGLDPDEVPGSTEQMAAYWSGTSRSMPTVGWPSTRMSSTCSRTGLPGSRSYGTEKFVALLDCVRVAVSGTAATSVCVRDRLVKYPSASSCSYAWTLALTEEGTLLAEGGVSDETWAEAEKQFSQTELAQIIALIATVNAWNRIGVISRNQPPTLDGTE